MLTLSRCETRKFYVKQLNYLIMDKTCLFFRGRLYKNTFRNRVVGRVLTWFYNFRFFFFVLVINVLFFSACSPAVKHDSEHFLQTDSILCDSFTFAGHSYVQFCPYSPITEISKYRWVVLHSPDCVCRYNRTFIVIKRNK